MTLLRPAYHEGRGKGSLGRSDIVDGKAWYGWMRFDVIDAERPAESCGWSLIRSLEVSHWVALEARMQFGQLFSSLDHNGIAIGGENQDRKVSPGDAGRLKVQGGVSGDLGTFAAVGQGSYPTSDLPLTFDQILKLQLVGRTESLSISQDISTETLPSTPEQPTASPDSPLEVVLSASSNPELISRFADRNRQVSSLTSEVDLQLTPNTDLEAEEIAVQYDLKQKWIAGEQSKLCGSCEPHPVSHAGENQPDLGDQAGEGRKEFQADLADRVVEIGDRTIHAGGFGTQNPTTGTVENSPLESSASIESWFATQGRAGETIETTHQDASKANNNVSRLQTAIHNDGSLRSPQDASAFRPLRAASQDNVALPGTPGGAASDGRQTLAQQELQQVPNQDQSSPANASSASGNAFAEQVTVSRPSGILGSAASKGGNVFSPAGNPTGNTRQELPSSTDEGTWGKNFTSERVANSVFAESDRGLGKQTPPQGTAQSDRLVTGPADLGNLGQSAHQRSELTSESAASGSAASVPLVSSTAQESSAQDQTQVASAGASLSQTGATVQLVTEESHSPAQDFLRGQSSPTSDGGRSRSTLSPADNSETERGKVAFRSQAAGTPGELLNKAASQADVNPPSSAFAGSPQPSSQVPTFTREESNSSSAPHSNVVDTASIHEKLSTQQIASPQSSLASLEASAKLSISSGRTQQVSVEVLRDSQTVAAGPVVSRQLVDDAKPEEEFENSEGNAESQSSDTSTHPSDAARSQRQFAPQWNQRSSFQQTLAQPSSRFEKADVEQTWEELSETAPRAEETQSKNTPTMLPELRTPNVVSHLVSGRNQAFEQIPETPLARQISEPISEFVSQEKEGTLTIELHPKELGHLKVSVRHSAEGLTAQLWAAEAVTTELLITQQQELKDSLVGFGFEDVSVDVSQQETDNPGTRDSRPQYARSSHPETSQPEQEASVRGGDTGTVNILA